VDTTRTEGLESKTNQPKGTRAPNRVHRTQNGSDPGQRSMFVRAALRS